MSLTRASFRCWLWAAIACAAPAASAQQIHADGFESFDDLVFVVPAQAPPQVQRDLAAVDTRLDAIDVYVILDRSGSMSQEITSVRDNLANVIANLRCPLDGSGAPGSCVADLWAGAGTVGYAGSGVDAFRHQVDIQGNPGFFSLSVTEPGGCCSEPLVFSVYSAITGSGGAAYGFTGVPERASCATSAAANAGYATFGYPCFRSGALPLLMLVTDEPPLSFGDTSKVPDWNTVGLPAMQARAARLVGITGSGFAANTDVDLRAMATATGAVNAANGNAPLVFDGAGTTAPAAIRAGVLAALAGLPLDLDVVLQDDGADGVDAIAAFVSRVETATGAGCATGLTTDDGNDDGFPDRYPAARNGVVACWRIVPRTNTSVPAAASAQTFHATLNVTGDHQVALGRRDVWFVVPAQP